LAPFEDKNLVGVKKMITNTLQGLGKNGQGNRLFNKIANPQQLGGLTPGAGTHSGGNTDNRSYVLNYQGGQQERATAQDALRYMELRAVLAK
jgi:hypothetical protein